LLTWGLKAKIPLPAFSAAWHYLMAISQADSSGNFIQAQRDFFGGHGLEWKNPKSNKGKHGPWHTKHS
jgi:6-phosphogluconate dehydrogenase